MALSHPKLIVIADRDYAGSDQRLLALVDAVGAAAEGKPVAVQLRARDISPEHLAQLAEDVRRRAPSDLPLILNGPTGLAVRLGFDGVHWPEAAIPGAPLPGPVPECRFAAVHSLAAAERALSAGATALVFAPVFAPGSKPGLGAGLPALGKVTCVARAVPVYALGGVLPERVPACLGAGAAGIAVISGVLGAPDPAAAIDAYLDAMRAVPS